MSQLVLVLVTPEFISGHLSVSLSVNPVDYNVCGCLPDRVYQKHIERRQIVITDDTVGM